MLQRFALIITCLFYALVIFGLGLAFGRSNYYESTKQYLNGALYALVNFDGIEPIDTAITTWTDQPGQTHDGVLLLGSQFVSNPAVVLVDNQGTVLHEWNLERKIFNPEVRALHGIPDEFEGIFHSADEVVLYPDGSLLFSQDIRDFNNLRSSRLAKIDKNSQPIWQLTGFFHHDLDVGEDGTIYAVGSELRDTIGLIDQTIGGNVKFVGGVVKVISPDGKLLREISVEDAFLASDYAHYLPMFDIDITVQELTLADGTKVYDPIHFNSVQHLDAQKAAAFPQAQTGDLLLSLRGNSTIALLRPETGRIVWASRGPWLHQHYVRMNANGKITIYDNDGGGFIASDRNGEPHYQRQSRLIQFDPVTQETHSLFYRPERGNFHSYWRGYYHPLADGSFILSSSDTGRVLQLDRNGDIIWELRTIADRLRLDVPYEKKIASVKYYEKSELPFLTDDSGSRAAAH